MKKSLICLFVCSIVTLFVLSCVMCNAEAVSEPDISSVDLNNDGVINMADVMILASSFNSCRGDLIFTGRIDLNGDGAINMADVMILAKYFNKKVSSSTSTQTTIPGNTPTPAMEYSLKFNKNNYSAKTITVNNKTINYRAYEKIIYVRNPVDPDYQCMNIYIPEEYFRSKSVGGFTADTAPIFLPITVEDYKSVYPSTIGSCSDASAVALSKGYLVAAPGVRGVNAKDSTGSYNGKAPASIVDLKAAVSYLRFNDDVMPGSAERIISNGRGESGALSALLGATGNNEDYKPYLAVIGAALARNDIFASSAYCPITNLENSDAAYEWQYGGINTYKGFEGSGKLTEDQIRFSNDLKKMFPAYVNSLKLKSPEGDMLILDENGEGTFKNYVKSILITAAQKALERGKDLSALSFITIKDGKVTDIDFEKYNQYVCRMKPVPVFDSVDLTNPENDLFGTAAGEARHFTEFGKYHSTVSNSKMADSNIISMMNPMDYIGRWDTESARYWRIRCGSIDNNTSIAIPAILASKLQNGRYDLDFALTWEIGHEGDYELDELFAWADKICHEEYDFDAATGTILKYKGLGGDVRIPGEINGVKVTGIGDEAFYHCFNVTSVTIPDGVTSIGKCAFNMCPILSVTIPESVTSMGAAAFIDCPLNNVIFMGDQPAFKIEDVCYQNQDTFEMGPIYNLMEFKITILPTAKGFGRPEPYNKETTWKWVLKDAFMDGIVYNICVYDTSLADAGDYIFSTKTGVIHQYKGNGGDVAIPGEINGVRVTGIGEGAFERCSNLTGITIPKGVTSINYRAFEDCTGLKNVTMQTGVTGIGDYAFYGCNSLKSVTLPESVLSIGEKAFYGCSQLINAVFLGNQPTTFGWNVFDRWIKNFKIYVLQAATGFGKPEPYNGEKLWKWSGYDYEVTVMDDSEYDFDAVSGTIIKYKGMGGDVRIPLIINGEKVTGIGKGAFSENGNNITSVMIPYGVTGIGEGAFSKCSITSAYLPESVTGIGKYAFSGCPNLKNITIPASVTNIGDFAFSECSSLNNVVFLGNQPSFSVSHVLGKVNSGFKITVFPNSAGYGRPEPYNNERLWYWGHDSEKYLVVAGDADYDFDDSTGTIKRYKGPGGNIRIPHMINGIKVTVIGKDAFNQIRNVTGVIIPYGVTSIEDSAFYICDHLSGITIPDSVTSIGRSAFNNCERLISIIIPDSVTSIGAGAFFDCENLKNVKLPESITRIERCTFYFCRSLKEIVIPKSVTFIGDDAFYACHSLGSVTIPENVNTIQDLAFGWCGNLSEAVFLGNQPINFDPDAFSGRYDFKIYVSKEVKGFGKPYPYNNENNWEWTPGEDVTYRVFIPQTSEDAGDYVFVPATGTIKEYKGMGGDVIIPEKINGVNVTVIGDSAFAGCSNLTGISIPQGVTSINIGAFYNCNRLASISIPDSVTSIGGHAFQYCDALKSVTIPNGVTGIEEYTFYGCGSLASISIPDSVTGIGYDAFGFCTSLTSITIPGSVTGIESEAFGCCSQLSNAVFKGSEPSNFALNVFYRAKEDFKITVSPAATGFGKPNPYNNETSWTWNTNNNNTYKVVVADNNYDFDADTGTILKYKGQGGDVSIPDMINGVKVTGIRWGAFSPYDFIVDNASSGAVPVGIAESGCSKITSITIPEGVIRIDGYAFYGCSSLKSITIPDSVSDIGEGAFYECSSLKNIIIPKGVTIIENNTFYGCIGLTSAIIPEGVNGIGSYAFEGCIGLKSIIIPDSVVSIGYHAFYGCTGLTEIIIPKGVTSIGEGAFYGCSRLSSIIISESVTSMELLAFGDCNSLSNAVFMGDQPSNFGDNVFYGTKEDFKISVSKEAKGFGKPDLYNNESNWEWTPVKDVTYRVFIHQA